MIQETIGLPNKGEQVGVFDLIEICRHYGRTELIDRILADPPARPFISDGCSAWPDQWQEVNMYEDCFLHDIEYWVGGTPADKLAADLQLALGVCRKGAPQMAEIMLAGVRTGGVDWLPTPWRWGFGRRG